jgi:MFS family permease
MYRTFRPWKYFNLKNRYIHRFAILVFLYAIANGMISFILPVFLQEKLNSLTLVGIILASSSIWNILTDLTIGFLKKPPNYLRLMQLVGLSIFLAFLGIWLVDEVWMYVLVVALWGILTEMFAFSNFGFVINSSKEKERAGNFGILANFLYLGYSIAPVIVGAVIIVSRDLTMATGVYFAVGILIYFNLQKYFKKLPVPQPIVKRRLKVINELKLWFKIGKKVWPLLLIFLIKGVSDGALFSFVPIFVESNPKLKYYGGLILSSIFLPMALLGGWFGHQADKWGRKKFILTGLATCAFSLMLFGFSGNGLIAILLALAIGLGYSLYSPVLDALASSYIERHQNQESEVESEDGIFYNFGFIIGAMLTGFLATILGGFGPAFAVFGGLYLFVFGIFFLFAPRKHTNKDGMIK